MAEEDKIIVIATIEDDEYPAGKPYKKVTDIEGEVYKIKYGRGGKLKEKWPLLEEGLAVRLIFGEYTNPSGVKFPFVEDFELVKDGLSPQTEAMEPVGLVNETGPKAPPAETPPPTGQTIGMCWKEIGELARMGLLDKFFGRENAVNIAVAYRGYLLSTLRIPFDGKTLPQFKTEDKERSQ